MMKMYLIYKNSSVFNNVNIMNRYRGNGLLSQHLIYRCWPFFRGKTYNFDCQIRGIHNNIVLLNSQQSQNNNLININGGSNNVLSLGSMDNIITKDIITDGYKGYSVLKDFGDVQYLLNNDIDFNKLIYNFLKSLDDNNTYTLLSIVRYFNYEERKSTRKRNLVPSLSKIRLSLSVRIRSSPSPSSSKLWLTFNP